MLESAQKQDVFQAIAGTNRRRLLDLLRTEAQPVGALVEATGLSYPLVSQHLRTLLEAGVVDRRADGKARIYTLNAAPLLTVHEWTGEYEQFWRESLTRLRGRLEP